MNQPLSIPEAAEAVRLSVSAIYEELAAGRLIGRKIGRRTVIYSDELERWLNALPAIKPSGLGLRLNGEPRAARKRSRDPSASTKSPPRSRKAKRYSSGSKSPRQSPARARPAKR
jgi:excisionase family DNA binding protein